MIFFKCLELGGDFDYINKCKYVPDVFLFSTSLYMFTFICAMGLKFFRFTRFLPFPVSFFKGIINNK